VRSKGPRHPKPETRKVQRPPYEQLVAEIAELGYRAVGRKYGVSDNAVRKWIRWYRSRAAPQQPL
jgi:transposase-like protein